MTGAFDFIRELITMAEEGQEGIADIIYDVFPYCAALVTDDYYELQNWCRRELGQTLKPRRFTLKEWYDYFSDVHDLDHATDHRAFKDSGYRIIGQLRRMLQVTMVWKRDFRTLFRESIAAQSWFHKNFIYGSSGIWHRRKQDEKIQ